MAWRSWISTPRRLLERLESFEEAEAEERGGRQEEDPESFSSGQKQKAAILMALVKEADLYVFDEPLANVDLASQEMLLERIFEATRGKTLVMAMHCDREVASRFDRAIDLDETGRAAGSCVILLSVRLEALTLAAPGASSRHDGRQP